MPLKNLIRAIAAAVLGLTASLGVHAADLTVSAAASLTNAFSALGPLFQARYAGTTVVFNFAASDTLLAQIAKGAPVDVFAAADQDAMDRAERQQLLVPGSRRDFVGNALVMIVPVDGAPGITAPADLQRPGIRRVAIGNPASVPVGRYAKGALQAAGLWAGLEPKAVLAQSVRQALDYVARGEVDAGFVYATDAAIMRDRVRVADAVPTTTPIRYPIAAIAGGPNPAAAREFIDFLATPAARGVLARYGFDQP